MLKAKLQKLTGRLDKVEESVEERTVNLGTLKAVLEANSKLAQDSIPLDAEDRETLVLERLDELSEAYGTNFH